MQLAVGPQPQGLPLACQPGVEEAQASSHRLQMVAEASASHRYQVTDVEEAQASSHHWQMVAEASASHRHHVTGVEEEQPSSHLMNVEEQPSSNPPLAVAA